MDATPITLSPEQAFRLAVDRAGGQTRFADLIGRTQGAVSKRLSGALPLWPESVLKAEAATGISRHELRPDIYPIEDQLPGNRPGEVSPAVPPHAAGGAGRFAGARP